MLATRDVEDPAFDRVAGVAHRQLDVPVAVVALTTPSGLLLVGAHGLPAHLQTARTLAAADRTCTDVLRLGEPLVLDDADDERLVGCPLLVGASAYVGHPVRDASGAAVGTLAVLDTRSRAWSQAELALVADLAAACSTQVQLRQARRRTREIEGSATSAGRHARLLLALSEALARTTTVSGIATTLLPLASTGLGATHAGIAVPVPAERRLAYVAADGAGSASWSQLPLDASTPVGASTTDGATMFFPDRSALDTAFPQGAGVAEEAGDGARACLPLQVAGERVGALYLGWDEGEAWASDGGDRAVIEALTRYTAQAVQRARLLEQRREVARTLQEAMLTDLPQVDHLEVRARYVPAADGERVGGDWYDAFITPAGDMVVAIGDVVGHDMAAAAVMGQLRSMLRVLAWSVGGEPSELVARLDRAMAGLGIPSAATALLARVEQSPAEEDRGLRRLHWTNAGHPPPVLLHADGRTELLERPVDLMLGVLPERDRHDHDHTLPPGSTLLLCTDGLIERRGTSLAEGLAALQAALVARRGQSLDELMEGVVDDLVGASPGDDVALLAIRLHPEDEPRPAEAGPRTA